MSRPARAWPAVLAPLLLAACTPDAPADASAAAASAPAAADVAGDDASCAGHPLAAVLPATPLVADRPLRWRSCDAISAAVRYGDETPDGGGDHCTVTITDPRARNPDVPEVAGLLDQAGDLLLTTTRANVAMLDGARQGLLDEPVMLDLRGGASTLPVVERLENGDTWVVAVPARTQTPTVEAVQAVLRERYVLDVTCREPVRDHAHAMALYAPYTAALDLEALP